MEKREVLEHIQDIFRDVLDDDELILEEKGSTENIKGYDSLTHIQIVSEIQNSFGIKFTAREMISWDNVGEMCDTIVSKFNK